MINIAINGLGRIGRLVFRKAISDKNINISLINSPSDIETIAHLIKYDSAHLTADFDIKIEDNNLIINGQKILVSHSKNPFDIQKLEKQIDFLVESSGKFNGADSRNILLSSGANKIIVSSPSENADKTIVLGVNHHNISKDDKIISLGSCTTNAIGPIAKIINDHFKIKEGFVTTIHSYTSDQNLVDNSHSDLRRARAAAFSMIPTKTGAAKSIGKILPELDGKLDGSAVRVPTLNVSMIDFVCNLEKKISKNEIDQLMIEYSEKTMKGILSVAKSQLVSIDFNHSEFSSIYDPFETRIINDKMLRLVSWYDNEWAFACRILDVIKLIYNM